jgi:hypothetical protein
MSIERQGNVHLRFLQRSRLKPEAGQNIKSGNRKSAAFVWQAAAN